MNRTFLLILFLLFFLSGALWHARTIHTSDDAVSAYQNFFPKSHQYQKHTTPFPYIEVWGANKNLLGYIILTDDLHLNITGYAGPTPLALALNPEGKIINLRALPNNETPSYTGQLESFLKQFLGASSERALKIGEDVDAITHATITSEAMTATIRETLKRFSNEILKQHVTSTTIKPSLDRSEILFPLALLSLALSALFLRNTFLRWITLISGFIYFGLMTQTMLSITQIANVGLGNIPDFTKTPLWFMTLGMAFFAALLVGRLYCGSLCPFAFLQEILNKTVRRQKLPSLKIHHRVKMFKYIFLFLILGICFTTGRPSAADMEPFVTLFAAQGTKLAWGLVGFMLILAIFYHRFWCVYLCPVGALTGLFSKISFFKIKADPACTQCGTCVSRCPTRAIELIRPTQESHKGLTINESECILCGKCLQGCPEKCLTLRPFYHDDKR